ncbi:MAG: GNAT family N-acetyltransferase [Lachnospiraceae bacterium]|jgi:RimJ/RimL family protein N-acetyltransferase|nr:GNAT family N-acetyltransferase [Lachnospiraceae bacterium]MCX4317636.1 GNAT family protein [Lachnospiraceae bacterium]
MRLAEERYSLKGKEIVLRSARLDEAQMLVDYLKTVTKETRFLMSEPDEITYTQEEEEQFIKDHNEAKDALLIVAFVDGDYAGNCSFTSKAGSRRAKHRAGVGIALFQKYTGFGLGRLMLQRLLQEIKAQGFEQAELTVVGGNERAYHLYESLGFQECGRIPNANKYDDGTYAEDIFMVLPL